MKSPDGDSILDLIVFMWIKRGWLWLSMAVVLSAGLAIAILTPPEYYSEATIAPKTTSRDASPLAQFKLLQLGTASSDLGKMEILLGSPQMAEEIVRKYNLAPFLFGREWDAGRGQWKNPQRAPSIRKAAEKLKEGLVVQNDFRKNVIVVGMLSRDSVMSARIVGYFVAALNDRMREDVISAAEANQAYLEKVLAKTADPILIGKVQELLSSEIEKAMLVNTQSIEMWIDPEVPMRREKPKRKKIILISLVLGMFVYGVGSTLVFFGRGNVATLAEKLKRRET